MGRGALVRRRVWAMDISRTLRHLVATTVALLMLLLLAPAAQAQPTPSDTGWARSGPVDEGAHDAFYATVRLPGHGRCSFGKSDAQRRALMACSDGWEQRVRRCPQEDSRHCYWHAPSRGNGIGRSFVVLEGVRRYFRG